MPNKHDTLRAHPTIMAVKAEAREMAEAFPGLTIGQRIERAAQARGYKTYAALRADVEGQRNDNRKGGEK
ncbi:hypothetical protein EVC30_093 [Rhizobium phage RHph_Y1_11]|nr:hypothetical protein EVC30_093 [Rhizobium phage RHph_Y1_11]